MPISSLATPKPPMVEQRFTDSGVTMIEMLVVLSVIAVSAGIVALALPGTGPSRTLIQEASFLAARLNLAAERSLTEGRNFRMDWSAEGYRFDEWTSEGWQKAIAPPLSEDYSLNHGAILSDADEARRGSVTVTPDMLLPDTRHLELRLRIGNVVQIVTFDGMVARLETNEP